MEGLGIDGYPLVLEFGCQAPEHLIVSPAVSALVEAGLARNKTVRNTP